MPSARTDQADMKACLSYLNMTSRCAGGRLVVTGYVCLHCGAESPSEKCKRPARKPA